MSEVMSQGLSVRFGIEILKRGFTAAPNDVLNHYAKIGVSLGEMMFCIHVWQFWWSRQSPYPSLGTISEAMGVSRRQARNYAQSLKDKGLLIINTRILPDIGQTSSEYDFTPFFEAILAVATSQQDSTGTGMQDSSTPPRKDSSEGGRKDSSEAPRKKTSYKEDPVEEDKKEEEIFDSKSLSEPSNFIFGIVSDAHRDLHDISSLQSNLTRCGRLQKDSNLSDKDFADILIQAKAEAQSRAVGKETPDGRKNRMPYFWSVVENLLKPEETQRPKPKNRAARPSEDRDKFIKGKYGHLVHH